MGDEQRKGNAYRLLDKLPPEARAKIEAALAGREASSVETSNITIRRMVGTGDPPTIEVNGKCYASVDEVPAEYRDEVAGLMNSQPSSTPAIKINGRSYGNLAEVPPEFRDLLERALGKVPDSGAAPSVPHTPSPPNEAARAALFSGSDERPRSSLWWILLGIAAIAAAVYLTLKH